MNYSNIDWYCDNCGIYLNDQPGFDENQGTFNCPVCGHRNNLSDDEIIDIYDNGSFSHKTGEFTPMSPYGRTSPEDMDSDVDYDSLEKHSYADTPGEIFYRCPKCGESILLPS